MLENINKDTSIAIKTINDVVRCITLSSLLEISGWPKPGNIHRTRDYSNTKFEHFLAAIASIQPNFYKFCQRIKNYSKNNQNDFSYVNLGSLFKEATEKMIEWQHGGNVILGHILVLTPLAATAVICLILNKLCLYDFKSILKKVIEDTTVQDTIFLYESIRISNAGGLGKVERYDINDENAFNEIKDDQITLKKIFEYSQNIDSISKEYSTGFKIILDEGLPYYIDIFNKTNNINIATVNTFLKILSKYPDTLIIKKSGLESAKLISKKAKKIINIGGMITEKGKKEIENLDNELYKENGKFNPGTTADLIAGIIFCSLIFGLKI